MNEKWEQFFYGNTCVREAPLSSREIIEGRFQSGNDYSLGETENFTSTLSERVQEKVEPDQTLTTWSLPRRIQFSISKKNIARLRKMISTLDLSQKDAANLIGISHSALTTILSGKQKEVFGETAAKIGAFLQIANLLKTKINKGYSLRAAIHNPATVFGNINAIDFSQKKRDGVFEVLAIFKRMYG